MKRLLSLLLIATPGAASAHVGHIAEAAGHNHWVAGVAIGAVVAVAVWGWIKDSKDDGQPAEEDTQPEAEEAAARRPA